MSRTVTVQCSAIPQLDGKPALTFVRLTGRERVDELFTYTLELKTPDDRNESYAPAADADLKKFVGQECSVSIELDGDGVREINGLITRARISRVEGRHVVYALALKPWLWLATRTSDFRIFQEKSVVDILDEVLGDYAFPVDKRLSGEYPAREYMVQYGESDFAFMQRLMQEWGIYWFFEHADGKHRLVLCDDPSAHNPFDSDPYKTLRLHPGDSKIDEEHLSSFELAHSLTSGAWTSGDFDFTKPHADLTTVSRQPGDTAHADAEFYEWPGDYAQPDEGDSLARTRMEAIRASALRGSGTGTVRAVVTGCTFTLEQHPHQQANMDWLILDTDLTLEDVGEETGVQQYLCRVSFSAQPADEPYRPARTQPKPYTHGPQTALVTGPDGQEIWTDKYGRVKVQFHWDRYGKKDEKSSCWVRVSQAWAGENFGAVHIPRIGQEVIVDFLLGDPDRPIITGRVYNAANLPPWDLPDNATQSGILSRSSKDGGKDNANALRFEDKKGEEEVWLHAEKDQLIEVENDESHQVGHDRKKNVDNDETVTIGHDRTEEVGNDEAITIGHDQKITIKNDQSATVMNDQSLSVMNDRSKSVMANETTFVAINQMNSVGAFREDNVGAGYSLLIGAQALETVALSKSVTVGSSMDVTVASALAIQSASRKDGVGKNHVHEVGENLTITSGKNYTLDVGEKLEITCGKSSISMDKEGNITIKGKNLQFQASGDLSVKASGEIAIKGKQIKEN